MQGEDGRETATQREREGEMNGFTLKRHNSTFTPSAVKMCTRKMPGEVFWPPPSVCQLYFMSLQLQQRMPIYIPGVSFHYFYLRVAVSWPGSSGGSVRFKRPLDPEESHELKRWCSFMSASLPLSRVSHNYSYWQKISAGALQQGNYINH